MRFRFWNAVCARRVILRTPSPDAHARRAAFKFIILGICSTRYICYLSSARNSSAAAATAGAGAAAAAAIMYTRLHETANAYVHSTPPRHDMRLERVETQQSATMPTPAPPRHRQPHTEMRRASQKAAKQPVRSGGGQSPGPRRASSVAAAVATLVVPLKEPFEPIVVALVVVVVVVVVSLGVGIKCVSA